MILGTAIASHFTSMMLIKCTHIAHFTPCMCMAPMAHMQLHYCKNTFALCKVKCCNEVGDRLPSNADVIPRGYPTMGLTLQRAYLGSLDCIEMA